MTFDTSLLKKAIIQQAAEREHLRRQTLADVQTLLDELAPQYGLEEAYLFGSVVKNGRFHEKSDVDIAVTSLKPEGFFGLLSDLSLALGRDVDMVPLEHCHFAHRIREEGILWTKKQ